MIRQYQDKFLGTAVIVTGSLTDIGDRYHCRFGTIQVETAVWQASCAATIRHDL